mgnify:CR=1 FL=1
MKTVVLKFGGTSVGSIDRIKKVCKIISSYKKKKNKVVVISSAFIVGFRVRVFEEINSILRESATDSLSVMLEINVIK